MGLSEIKKGGASELVEASSEVVTAGQDWAGVAYVDPDAVGANPTAKIYPDGSIVGITDNGSYTKWANGDLECKQENLNIGVNTTATWIYPMAFTKVLTVIPIGYHTAAYTSNIGMADATSVTAPSPTQAVIRNKSTTIGNNLFVTANGRWKA